LIGGLEDDGRHGWVVGSVGSFNESKEEKEAKVLKRNTDVSPA